MPALAAAGLEHSLPWYFGFAVFVVWAGLMVALGYLVRRRFVARAERRASFRRDDRARPGRDDHALGPGTDVEIW